VVYALYGSATGLAAPTLLRDRAGEMMHAGRYWHPETKAHTGAGERAYSALPLDWDGDGDLDLVVGTNGGTLQLRENEGTATEPAFATSLRPLGVSVPGGYAMPFAADWDGDGRWDLISGSKTGAVYWFRNRGTADAPRLADPEMLVPAGGDLGMRTQATVADFDGDGDLDLLVGDYHSGKDRHGWVWLYRRESVSGEADGSGHR